MSCRRGPTSSASTTSSSSTWAACASSAIVGERPRVAVSSLEESCDQLVELLQPARDGDGPDAVPEVPPELADDGREDVGDELDIAIEVEAVDRLDQPDGRDLDEIVELLTAPRVPSRKRPDERHEVHDQLVAGAWRRRARARRAAARAGRDPTRLRSQDASRS